MLADTMRSGINLAFALLPCVTSDPNKARPVTPSTAWVVTADMLPKQCSDPDIIFSKSKTKIPD